MLVLVPVVLTFFIHLYNVLCQAQVILNIHSEDESSLEVHRINTLLAHGCCVVSERGSDLSLTQKVLCLHYL